MKIVSSWERLLGRCARGLGFNVPDYSEWRGLPMEIVQSRAGCYLGRDDGPCGRLGEAEVSGLRSRRVGLEVKGCLRPSVVESGNGVGLASKQQSAGGWDLPGG